MLIHDERYSNAYSKLIVDILLTTHADWCRFQTFTPYANRRIKPNCCMQSVRLCGTGLLFDNTESCQVVIKAFFLQSAGNQQIIFPVQPGQQTAIR